MFKQNIFLYTRTKWRPIALIYLIYWTDSSGVLIYGVPSVKIQYSKRVLQQTKCKLNCMQNHMITRHIYITFILNRIYINNIQLSFWSTKLCIQSKTKETSKSVTIKAGRKTCDIYQWCAVFIIFFSSVECFCRNIPFVWVNLLCLQTRRSPNVMGIRWHLKAITIREVLQANCTLIKQDLHCKKSSPQYKLSQKKKKWHRFLTWGLQSKVLCWTLLQSRIQKASKSSEILICIVVDF